MERKNGHKRAFGEGMTLSCRKSNPGQSVFGIYLSITGHNEIWMDDEGASMFLLLVYFRDFLFDCVNKSRFVSDCRGRASDRCRLPFASTGRWSWATTNITSSLAGVPPSATQGRYTFANISLFTQPTTSFSNRNPPDKKETENWRFPLRSPVYLRESVTTFTQYIWLRGVGVSDATEASIQILFTVDVIMQIFFSFLAISRSLYSARNFHSLWRHWQY